MADWLGGYARALEERLDGALPSMTAAEVDQVLDLARVVAHGAERKFAPLSTYLAGRYVAARVAAGADPAVAVGEALTIAEQMIEPGPR